MPGCRKFTESFDLGYVGASANSAANASFLNSAVSASFREFCSQCELLRILRSIQAQTKRACQTFETRENSKTCNHDSPRKALFKLN